MDYFETEELKAYKLIESDYDKLIHLYSNEKVCATLGGVKTKEWVNDYLEKNMLYWKQYGYGCWIFSHKESNSFAGRGVIRHVDIEGKDEIEIGYALMPEFWGKGYATQMAKELIFIAFNKFKIPELVSFALVENLASRRVMQKSGFKFERNIIYSGLPHVLYRLKNELSR